MNGQESERSMESESIWNKYSPTFTPWFESEFTYEGWGKATFENPIGTVEGKTKISVDELGNLNAKMEYELLETEAVIDESFETFRLMKFLHRSLDKNGHLSKEIFLGLSLTFPIMFCSI